MEIRYVCSDQDSRTNEVLNTVARRAAAEGLALAGTVQVADPERPDEKCLIILELLPDREKRNISVDLGPGVTGCRLNPEALEDAVMVVESRLATAHALIVNKFGKQEAAGRGLVAAIGEAAARGLPILVGVSPEWRAAFEEFADGGAVMLPADEDDVMDWLRVACRNAAAA